MKVGVPSEIKAQESRVGLTPQSVKELVKDNHTVLIQNNAGLGAGFSNSDYENSGAKILNSAEDIFNASDMIIKVKEPLMNEVAMLKENQILFTYLHLSAAPQLTKGLIDSKSICIAYETVSDHNNKLPLLAPMSAVAGRMSIQAGAYSLERHKGGSGLLLGGAPGVLPGKVFILGGGVVGENAAIIATGMQAKVFIVDKSEKRLDELKEKFGDKIEPLHSDKINIQDYISECDLLVGGVLVPGSNAPKIITKQMIKEMKSGSVIVDVAIDQGGCVETSKPTTHANPTYIVDDVVHYCVANMPGAVPYTSTMALSNSTIPYIRAIANHGYRESVKKHKPLLYGLNIHKGKVVHPGVASSFDLECTPVAQIFD